MNRDQILENNEIVDFITQSGATIKDSGSQKITNTCPVVGEHKSGHNCVTINPDKQVWHCNDCDKGGSVIDWVAFKDNTTVEEAMKILGGGETATQETRDSQSSTPSSTQQSKEICTYHYTNENGQLLYQVVRYEPKTFRQRQPKGWGWKWDLEGVTRVLYNLPEVLKAKTVCVTEGEKDANNLNDLGFVATTNAGGAKSWLPAYADTLKGRDVVVFEDADRDGKDWADKVVESCRDKATSVKRIKMAGMKDVSVYIEKCREEGQAPSTIQQAIQDLIDKTPHVVEPMEIYSIWEMEDQFAANVNDERNRAFSMANFSSKFKTINDRLTPGEVVMIVGDTSMGKTAVMQALAVSARPLKTLMFELELPLDTMFMRSVQMQQGCYQSDIIQGYKQNPKGRYADRFDRLQHIMICPRSGLTMDDVERYIVRSELKFGERPGLVFVDYMGLVRKDRTFSRYEAMAYSAEQCKVVAKRANTIMVIGSQVSRPQGSKEHVQDVQIHHAKGAGELENSSNLVLGLSRPDEKTIKMKVLKNTNGPIGAELEFDFDPAKMQIRERIEA